jgi:hypothetical protein
MPAPYRDRRNFMVKLKHYISGTGQRDYSRLTVGQEFVEVLEYGYTNCEWGLPRTVIAEILWLNLNIISLVRGGDGDDLRTTLMLPAMGIDPVGNVFHDLFGIGTRRK